MIMPDHVDPDLDPDYLKTAHAMGLGYNDLNFIEYHHLKHEKW